MPLLHGSLLATSLGLCSSSAESMPAHPHPTPLTTQGPPEHSFTRHGLGTSQVPTWWVIKWVLLVPETTYCKLAQLYVFLHNSMDEPSELHISPPLFFFSSQIYDLQSNDIL